MKFVEKFSWKDGVRTLRNPQKLIAHEIFLPYGRIIESGLRVKPVSSVPKSHITNHVKGHLK